MLRNVVVFGTFFTITSDEFITSNFNLKFVVTPHKTLGLNTVTQPGTFDPEILTVEAKFFNDSHTKFTNFINMRLGYPVANLTFLNFNFQECFLEDINLKIVSLNSDARVLEFDANLRFIKAYNTLN